MITSAYGVDFIEDSFSFALKIDLTFIGIVSAKAWEQCFKCERYGHYEYWCSSENQHVNFVPSDGVDDSKIVKDAHIHSEISSVVEDPLANPDTPIINESHVSSAGTNDVMDALADSSVPTLNEVYIHEENQES